MKSFFIILSTIALSSIAFADSFNNMNEVVSASKLLEDSPKVNQEIQAQISNGFEYYGFISHPSTSYCNCKKFILIFKISDYYIHNRDNGTSEAVIVKKLVEISNEDSSVKIFTMTDSLGI